MQLSIPFRDRFKRVIYIYIYIYIMIPTFQKESLHKDWEERDEGKKVNNTSL